MAPSENGNFQTKPVLKDPQICRLSKPEVATKHLTRTKGSFVKHRANCSGWVSSDVTFINHLFIGSSEEMMANMRIRHHDCDRNNPALLPNITAVDFVGDAEQGFPFLEIILAENAASREDAVVCLLFRRKFPL
jgi:hypothetical protein